LGEGVWVDSAGEDVLAMRRLAGDSATGLEMKPLLRRAGSYLSAATSFEHVA